MARTLYIIYTMCIPFFIGSLFERILRVHQRSRNCPTPFDGARQRRGAVVPAGSKCLSHLFPAQALRPAGQKPRVGLGQPALARGPGHALDPPPRRPDTAPAAVRTENTQRCPTEAQTRNVARAGYRKPAPVSASGAFLRAARARAHLSLSDRLCAQPLNPAHRRVHKGFELMDPTQDGLDLHPTFDSSALDGQFSIPSSQRPRRGALLRRHHPLDLPSRTIAPKAST